MHTKEEIRAEQERMIADVERQLEGAMLHIEIGDKLISREAAWAATKAIRACWSRGYRYGGQRRTEAGAWFAIGEALLTTGETVEREIHLGRCPREIRRTT